MAETDLPAFVADQLAAVQVPAGRLVFEMTETAAIANMGQAAALAGELRELGCRFVLDDFGAGFASFAYIKLLPLDGLKLDGEFIRDLPRSPSDRLLVRAMVEVAHDLGLSTIAEYVQDAETETLLSGLGVDYAQGYHVGRPEPCPLETLQRP
jgi:EAL domain-containing protein (putative c-di-GMP-specific phosphodiesterase class I)